MLDTFYYDHEENISRSLKENMKSPRICGHCKMTGEQIYLTGVDFLPDDPDDTESQLLLIAACQNCGKATEHYYKKILYDPDTNDAEYEFQYTYPHIEELDNTLNISDDIKDTFPDFVKIYSQSVEAEENGLDHLAGMGYRKSLEFLITDFLLKYLPEGITEEWLKSPATSLSQKISKLSNQRIQKLSKAISYIGNDETHYSRRHPEHDVDSIKLFIKALLSDMENEIILLEAEKLLNKPKK